MASSGDSDRSPLDTAVRVGVVLLAVGTIATIATLVPLFSTIDPLPVAVYLLSFLAPLGLAVTLVALWQRARTRSTRLRATPHSHPE